MTTYYSNTTNMATGITTCRRSFTMKFTRIITKGDLVNMSQDLTSELNILHSTNTITVKPEDITEGGFLIEYQENPGWYKSMRFLQEGYSGGANIKSFPWVPRNVMEEWVNSQDEIFCLKTKISTCLKAFNNAPEWSRDEINILKQVLSMYGVVCSKKK